jgi:hypothetical protein
MVVGLLGCPADGDSPIVITFAEGESIEDIGSPSDL